MVMKRAAGDGAKLHSLGEEEIEGWPLLGWPAVEDECVVAGAGMWLMVFRRTGVIQNLCAFILQISM
jgi:hypothetical protein